MNVTKCMLQLFEISHYIDFTYISHFYFCCQMSRFEGSQHYSASKNLDSQPLKIIGSELLLTGIRWLAPPTMVLCTTKNTKKTKPIHHRKYLLVNGWFTNKSVNLFLDFSV